jgi:hypothetical protein
MVGEIEQIGNKYQSLSFANGESCKEIVETPMSGTTITSSLGDQFPSSFYDCSYRENARPRRQTIPQ